MVNIENKKPGASFYYTWVLFSIVSGMIAYIVYLSIMGIYGAFTGGWIVIHGETHIAEDFLLPYILWPLYALLYGYSQYTLLRKYFPHMGWWFITTAVSLSLIALEMDMGRLVASTLGVDPYSIWLMVLLLMPVGGFLGVAQWFVLRRHIPNFIWWIPANIISWGVVGFSGAHGIFAFLVYPAVITGVALFLLLRQSDLQQKQV
jgi:hypothetical protein